MSAVFDFHARLGNEPGAAARLLATMDSTGIGRAAVAAGGVLDLDRLSVQILDGGHAEVTVDNERVRARCAAYPGRLVPFYFANPYQRAEVYRRAAPRYRGLELSPAVHGVGYDDPRVGELVEIAAQEGHPVYTVCLGRAGSRTADLVALARTFPSVTFVFGHCGCIGIDAAALRQIAPQENIVAETSGCLTVVVRLALQRLGPDRVLFGSEYPLQHPRVELAKFDALDLDPRVWRKVAWSNACRILGEVAP